MLIAVAVPPPPPPKLATHLRSARAATRKQFTTTSESISGQYLLEADPNILAAGPEHTLWKYTLGLFMTIVYACGVPLGTFLVLYFTSPKRRKYHSFLIDGFKDEFYYWECVITLRKLGLSMATTLLRPWGWDLQAFASLTVLLVAITLQVRLRPYASPELNRAELSGVMVATITIFCGLVLSSPNLGNPSAVLFFVIVIATVNCAFLFYILLKLYSLTKWARRQGLTGLLESSGLLFISNRSQRAAAGEEQHKVGVESQADESSAGDDDSGGTALVVRPAAT